MDKQTKRYMEEKLEKSKAIEDKIKRINGVLGIIGEALENDKKLFVCVSLGRGETCTFVNLDTAEALRESLIEERKELEKEYAEI